MAGLPIFSNSFESIVGIPSLYWNKKFTGLVKQNSKVPPFWNSQIVKYPLVVDTLIKHFVLYWNFMQTVNIQKIKAQPSIYQWVFELISYNSVIP